MQNNTKLLEWERPHYQDLDIKPILTYCVLGAHPANMHLDSETYRTSGVPEGVVVDVFDTTTVFEHLKQQQPSLWQTLQTTHPKLLEEMSLYPQSSLLRGTIDEAESLNYLRDVLGIIAALLDHGGIAVVDLITSEYWTAEEWKTRFFASPDLNIFAHANILAIRQKDDTIELQTSGLSKFGRPELMVEPVAGEFVDGCVEMLNRLISFQALGGVIPNGQTVQMEGVPEGMVCQYSETDPQKPDHQIVIYIGQPRVVTL